MYIRPIRLLLILSALVLVSMACSGTKATEAPVTPPTAPPTQTSAPTQPAAPQVDMGEVLREEDGGYTYQTPPGYAVNAGLGIVSMLAEGADPDVGPSISLFGGAPDPGTTAQSMIDQLKGAEDTQLSDPVPVKIGGHDGLAADITIQRNGIELVGQVVTVVTPENQFVALAGGPKEKWDTELKPIFESVLSSITFFTPTPVVLEPTEAPTEIPTQAPTQTPTATASNQGTTMRQWAITAVASSEYTDSSWNATQTTGEPTITECGDNGYAWASEAFDTLEWLEVSYTTPVIPVQVNIYETFNPGQIVKVELLDVDNIYHEVYTAKVQARACPGVLTIDISSADYQAISVRVTVDQSVVRNWAEIDAVELVGYAAPAP